MDNNGNFKTFYEKAYLLFPIFNGRVSELESRYAELCELVKTAGAEVVGYGFQVLREISPATIFGSGKLEEMLEEIKEKDRYPRSLCYHFCKLLSPNFWANTKATRWLPDGLMC